jgi:dipeptidyl aminopeptidase/acylaminoacyl peptidase
MSTAPSPMPVETLPPLMPEDIALLVDAGAPLLTPDGGLIYTTGRFKDGRRLTDLMYRPSDGETRCLLTGQIESPDLSPDGRRLAYVGEVQGERGVIVLDLDHPTPQLIARFSGSPRFPLWSPDGSRLLLEVLAPSAEAADDPRVMTRVRYDLNGLGHLGGRIWNVYVIDVGSGAATAIGDPAWHHFYPTWSPDGRSIALSTTRRADWDLEWVWDIYTVDLERKVWTRLTESDGVARMPRYTRDGRYVSYFHNHDATTSSTADYHLCVVAADGSERPRCLSHALDRGSSQGMVPGRMSAPALEGADGRFLWTANLAGRQMLVATDMEGRSTVVLEDATSISVSPDGRHAAGLGLSYDRPAEVCRIDLVERRITPVTDLNPWLRQRRPVPEPYKVVLETPDGPVENWVWEPAGSRPHPTLIFFHGGPHGAVGPYFPFLYQILPVSHGFAIACPNFRGSGGFGMAFADLCRENWGPKEGEDGAALIRHLIAAGVAEAGRIGVYGGSYGGFMTNWMITHYPDAQQAAVTMSTVSNLTTLAYGIDHWESIQTDMGGPPWSIPDYYREHSPITYVDRVQAPVLILHGGDDRTCPVFEAEQLFVALRWQKKPVTWVEYPKEAHGYQVRGRLQTRIDAARRILGWFETHLKGPAD